MASRTCCSSSSTSASRSDSIDAKPAFHSPRRGSRSNMLCPPQVRQRTVYGIPLLPMDRQGPLARAAQPVILTAPAVLLAPARPDQPLCFESMQHRVEHAFAPFDLAVRGLAHATDDRVPVVLPLGEDGHDDRPGGRRRQVFGNHHEPPDRIPSTVRHTIPSTARYVNLPLTGRNPRSSASSPPSRAASSGRAWTRRRRGGR